MREREILDKAKGVSQIQQPASGVHTSDCLLDVFTPGNILAVLSVRINEGVVYLFLFQEQMHDVCAPDGRSQMEGRRA